MARRRLQRNSLPIETWLAARAGHNPGMRIAHCQFETWVGEFEHNLKRVEEGLARAEAERAEIVSFPECFLTGYPDTEDPRAAARSPWTRRN
jgi:predicted amidohydrolase